MRYFNATEVTRPEADYVRQTTDESLSNTVVISLSSRWYDVRRLTDKELRDFVEQLLREELELVRAGGQIPH